jgi:E3 ubiquitin-protein ligase HUWE1
LLPSINDLMKSSPVILSGSSQRPKSNYYWQEERAKLLQFATGSSRVPLERFGTLQGAQGATKVSRWSIFFDLIFFSSCSMDVNYR